MNNLHESASLLPLSAPVLPLTANDPAAADAPTAARIVDAADLLRGSRVVLIEHRGALYRLSLTRNDRLVLQK